MKTSMRVFGKTWRRSLVLALITAMLVFSGVSAVDDKTPGQFRATTDCPSPVTLNSTAKHDGWILESAERSNKGGLDSRATTLVVGDDAKNRQYRGFLSFNTSCIPDDARITSAKLTLTRDGVIMGGDPFKTHGDLRLEILNSTFSTNLALRLSDFSAPISPGSTPETIKPGGVYAKIELKLSDPNLQYISKIGFTQFRLRFATNTDRDRKADYIRFFSGSANDQNNMPKLEIEYYIPPEIALVPTLVSPSNGATLPVGTVNFAWNPSDRADEYWVEWSGTTSGNSGWISATTYSVDLGMGVYRWRVKARNLGGESGWSEEWTLNVSSPPTPICMSPLPVGTVNFAWNPVNGAAEYRLIWDGTTSGDSGWISEPNYSVDLGLGVYRWRGKARNADIESDWNQECTMNISTPPTLVSPSNGATLPVGTVNFGWDPVNGATEYLLEWNGTQSGNSGWISATTYSVDLGMGVYRWRVKARNADIESDWSAEWTVNVSSPPTLVSPSDSATLPVGAIDFTWNPVNGATEYLLEWDGGIPGSSGWISGTSYSIDLPGSLYSWRVKARNGNIESDWSAEWRLTVIDPPAAPILISPQVSEGIGTEHPSPYINFTWNPVSNATEYYLEYSGKSSGSSGWISTTNYIAQTASGTTWRVKAKNMAGESPWSDLWTVTGNIFWTDDIIGEPPYSGYLISGASHTYYFNTSFDSLGITLSAEKISGDLSMILYFRGPRGDLIKQQGPGNFLSTDYETTASDVYSVTIKSDNGNGSYNLNLLCTESSPDRCAHK